MIKFLLMRRIQWRRDKMSSWPLQICKNIFDHVQQKKLEACNCTVQWSGGPKYQVDAGRGDQYMVDLDNYTCSCRKWDLLGIPCANRIAVIHYKGGKALDDYVNSYYSKDSYMALYNNLIIPINGSQLWEKTNQTAIKPPAYTRQLGRPRKDEAKARVRRKLAYARAKAAAIAKKAALNASQPNAVEIAQNRIESIQETENIGS
ncbi:unnamed protein product [Prunus armeniaca]